MPWLGEQWRKLRRLVFRARHARELDEELALHQEMRAARLRQDGLSGEDARDAARRRFGSVTLAREDSRAAWGWPWIETWLKDARIAVRTLANSPGFSATVILTLALGIGANTTAFGLLHGLLLRPLPAHDPDRLVVLLGGSLSARPGRFSYPNFVDIRDRARSFSSLSAFCWPIPLDVRPTPGVPSERAWAQLVSGSFFDTLGIRAALGRTFAADEDRTSNTHPVVVISQRYWRARFASDPAAIGRTVHLNGHAFTVIGVAPEPMPQVDPPFDAEMWVPMAVQGLVMPGQSGKPASRMQKWLRAIGRLNDEVTVAQAQAELTTLAGALEAAHPEENRRLTLSLAQEQRARAHVLGTGAVLPWVLSGLAGLVLLIACANLAGLLLVRTSARAREMSVRASLGAGRGRLLRQLLTEHILLAAAGGIAGLAIASVLSTRAWTLLVPPVSVPIWIDASRSRPLTAFAIGCTALTAALFGLVPALRATRGDLTAALKGSGGGAARPARPNRALRGSLHELLVVAQLALCVVVLAASALFVRSFVAALRIDVGFTPQERVIAGVQLGLQGYTNERTGGLAPRAAGGAARPADASHFHDALIARVRALPGVISASTTAFLPLRGGYLGDTVIIPDHERPGHEDEGASASQRPQVVYDRVGSDYLRAMGIRLLRGRDLTDADAADSPPVAVVNKAFAETFWPHEDPVGRRFRIGKPDAPVVEVVGLVPDGQYQMLGELPQRRMFLPVRQSPQLDITLIVHARGAPADTIAAIRREVAALDPRVPVTGAETMTEHVARSTAQARTVAALASAFGGLALFLAVLGVYGTLSFLVRGRTREIGVRIAVGARPAQVLRMVLARGVLLAACGVVTGGLAAVLVSRALTALLYGSTTLDVPTAAAVGTVLAGAVLAAAVLPARRALRIDVVKALRVE